MVKVRLFAYLKQIIGREEVLLPLPEGATVAMLLKQLGKDQPRLQEVIATGRVIVSINYARADGDEVIGEGDEVALLPPFSGGASLIPSEEDRNRILTAGAVRLQAEDFHLEAEIKKMKGVSKRIGGIVTFLGTARDYSRGRLIQQITFEHYPKMAEQCLAEIREEALKTFGVIGVTLIHRVGEIAIGENIVLVVVGAEHRQEAFRACAFCIDELKKRAPIWKKEVTPSGEFWVEDHA